MFDIVPNGLKRYLAQEYKSEEIRGLVNERNRSEICTRYRTKTILSLISHLIKLVDKRDFIYQCQMSLYCFGAV